jgi:UDP-N-acetylmuramate dehydrogenase
MFDKTKLLLDLLEFSPSENEPLAKFTTWKIGGPAEVLVQVRNSSDLQRVVQIALQNRVPYTILGSGSDTLIADEGVKGLVIINNFSRQIEILLDRKTGTGSAAATSSLDQFQEEIYNIYIQPRHGHHDPEFYTFEDLDYTDEGEPVYVKFDSGVQLPYAIAWTLQNQLTGLQWFAGIPGTIGGALFNNIHGGTKHFSDNFVSAEVLDKGEYKVVDFNYFEFNYDHSKLRIDPYLVVLTVTLKLRQGDIDRAKKVAAEWARRKRIQPRNTAGCVFKNMSIDKQIELGLPTPSIGYVTDKILGLRGKQFGGVVISPNHAAFIENLGDGKASHVIQAMREIMQGAKQKLGLELEPEIKLLGFPDDVLK